MVVTVRGVPRGQHFRGESHNRGIAAMHQLPGFYHFGQAFLQPLDSIKD